MSVRKVYLPKWLSWFGLVAAVAMWLQVTYMVWFHQPAAQRELLGWIISTLVLAVLAVVLWLMGHRRLPVYVIEEDDD